ncbi:hypothetical protein BG58_16420 [Caballeronia jiangsuensis]|nr:hypothetical protein BG58_16420 [Caballeronia jiangsuensis]
MPTFERRMVIDMSRRLKLYKMKWASRVLPLRGLSAMAMSEDESRVAPLTSRTKFTGYSLIASAPHAYEHMYSADLLIEGPEGGRWYFHALDFFYDATHALAYSLNWGRLWVKNNRRQSVTRTAGPDTA